MRIVISGATGLIGSSLVQCLRADGHTVDRLVRASSDKGDILWNPLAGNLEPSSLERADALIHLSGESIASGRWTPAKKQAIRDSRVRSTQLLASTIAQLSDPPKAWLCASAIGWYGNRGDMVLDEDSTPGDGFLAGVCKAWEGATGSVVAKGVRVVNLRFGVVLSPKGGALKQMMTVFKLGAGGVMGDGKQFISWIALHDAIRAILHALGNPFVAGPLNIVSPNPVTNCELTKTLGRVLRRPTVMPMPAALARLVFGEMADEMFLASARVQPKRLLDSGFVFDAPDLEPALREMIG